MFIVNLSYLNPNIALWMILVTVTICLVFIYAPRIRCDSFLYSLACSSDQKKTHSVQNESIMLSSLRFNTLLRAITGTQEAG